MGQTLWLMTPPSLMTATLPQLRWGGKREPHMIRKLPSGGYRLYSRKTDPRTGKRRNLGTFSSREKAEAHERAVQFFKHH